jgi:hypothetical protein
VTSSTKGDSCMPRKESHYPLDWLRIAEKDLHRVRRLLEMQDSEAAGFYRNRRRRSFSRPFFCPEVGVSNVFSTWKRY